METEIEAKFLDINPDELRKNLKKIGAILEYPERLMRRNNFKEKNWLNRTGRWVRLRDEGDKITLCYKQLNDRTLHGTKEITVIVDNFEKTNEFLKAIGLKQIAYQETKREKWMLDDTEITIDTWPWIPTFVEIESPDEKTVKAVAEKLGFNWDNALHGSVETAYQKYYDVTEEEIDNWETITFIPIPDWLLEKKL